MNTGVLGASFCRPSGALSFLHHYPRLAPWAAFLRRFAAGFGACVPGSRDLFHVGARSFGLKPET